MKGKPGRRYLELPKPSVSVVSSTCTIDCLLVMDMLDQSSSGMHYRSQMHASNTSTDFSCGSVLRGCLWLHSTSQGDGYAGTEDDLEAIFASAPAEVDLFVVHGPVESMEPAQKYIERCVLLLVSHLSLSQTPVSNRAPVCVVSFC